MTSRYDWLWKGLAVAYLAYYVLSPAPVVCASDKSTTTCRNVSHQVVVNETTEELCGYLSLAYCYFLSSCYCNITREVAKTHVTTVCEAQEFNSTTEEATRNASGRAVTIKPQMLISNTDEMAKNVSLKVGTVTVQSTTRKTASVSTMRHRVEAVSEESTLKTPAIGKISTSPEAPLAAAISPSTLPVTATTLPEDSADMAMSELYYNVSETNSSLLLGSDPGGTNTGASRGLFRNLTDAEVAAIAVISSLLFSIVLSITVFFIQRRHRGYLVRKNARTQVVQVQLADGEQAEGNAEGAAFLPPSQEQRYIHVKPANMAQNVYEQHPLHPPTDKAELSLESGKLSARYVTKPAAVASDQVKGSTPPAQPIVKPPDTSASKQNVYSDDFPSCELTVKPTEQPPVYSSLKSLHDPLEEKENDITSASSLQLNLSEDHYENVAPADT